MKKIELVSKFGGLAPEEVAAAQNLLDTLSNEYKTTVRILIEFYENGYNNLSDVILNCVETSLVAALVRSLGGDSSCQAKPMPWKTLESNCLTALDFNTDLKVRAHGVLKDARTSSKNVLKFFLKNIEWINPTIFGTLLPYLAQQRLAILNYGPMPEDKTEDETEEVLETMPEQIGNHADLVVIVKDLTPRNTIAKAKEIEAAWVAAGTFQRYVCQKKADEFMVYAKNEIKKSIRLGQEMVGGKSNLDYYKALTLGREYVSNVRLYVNACKVLHVIDKDILEKLVIQEKFWK